MSSPSYVDRAAPAWVRALLTALFACAALYAVLLVGGGELLGLPLDPESWLPLAVLNVCAACSCIGRAVYRRRERLAWALLGTGMLFSSSGYLLWAAVYEQQAAPPYPSLSDALWLPYYPFLLAAIVALLKAERPRIPATAWLDALIPACPRPAPVRRAQRGPDRGGSDAGGGRGDDRRGAVADGRAARGAGGRPSRRGRGAGPQGRAAGHGGRPRPPGGGDR